MIKKITGFTLLLLTSIFLVSCFGNKGKTDEVKIKNVTISYEGYEDDVNDDKKDYYIERNTDYTINIYLENDNKYNVESVVLNNETIEKENLILNEENDFIKINMNTKNDSGINEIKIGNIYVTINNKSYSLKDVKDNTINLHVPHRFTPTAVIVNEDASVNSHEITLNITDQNNLIDFENNDAKLVVYDNEVKVDEYVLVDGENNVEITNLKIDYKYDYKVILNYDNLSGKGKSEHILQERTFNTKEGLSLNVENQLDDNLEYSYEPLIDLTIEKISLYKEGVFVKELNKDETKLNKLDMGSKYSIEIKYSYKYNDEDIIQTQTLEAGYIGYEELIRSGRPVKHPDGRNVFLPNYKEQDEEVRGIWISTVSNIDIGTIQGENVESYKDEITTMFDNIKEANFNTVFFQIRPMNDAFYPSELAPWSRYVTGREGRDPGFDLLEFIINEAHSRELELHGWLNPYRVATSSGMFNGMDEKNFAKQNPDLLLTDNNGATILDPGKPRVQKYIRDVIMEIAENYPNINGIHFDDYFYLSTFGEDSNSPDYNTYLEFRQNSSQSIADFRRMSVTNMIKDIYEDIEEYNEEEGTNIRFGVSPSGIWANESTHPEGSSTRGYQHYSALYADTKLWIDEGYIHYIIPQIYWEFTLSAAPYAHLVDWWSEAVRGTDVDLIIGMGLYRYRENKWPTFELADQLRYNQTHPEVKGATFFTYQDIIKTSPASLKTVMDFIKDEYWKNEASLPWESNFN